MEVLCPFCNTIMIALERDGWFECPNSQCRCSDKKDTLYGKPKPLKWIEWKRKQQETP